MNRFLRLSLIGLAILLLLDVALWVVLWPAIQSDVGGFGVSFLASLTEDLVFFGLVAGSIALAQFVAHRGDTPRTRVRNLFANPEVSYAAVEYIENQVREAAVYCTQAEIELEVLDYDVQKRAYRLGFSCRYTFKNMFGDIRYEADIPWQIAPEVRSERFEPPGRLLTVAIEDDEGKKPLRTQEDLAPTGVEVIVPLDLKSNGSATVLMAWTSWASNVASSGISLKRFTERLTLTVLNKCSHVVGVSEPRDGAEICFLQEGEKQVLVRRSRIEPNRREGVWWHPPRGREDEADQGISRHRINPILTSRTT